MGQTSLFFGWQKLIWIKILVMVGGENKLKDGKMTKLKDGTSTALSDQD